MEEMLWRSSLCTDMLVGGATAGSSGRASWTSEKMLDAWLENSGTNGEGQSWC